MPSLTPRVTRAVAAVGMAHPLAMRRSAFGRHGRGFGDVLGFQVPMRPERRLTTGDGVERVLRDWSGGDSYPDPGTLRRYRRGMRVPFVAHSSMEYFRWAVRSVPRQDGRRFAAAVREPLTVPVLQLQGALDPYVAPDAAVASHRWAGPHLRYELVPGAGHFLPEEAPDTVTATLLDWLGSLADRP
jgi:pimeloyl-ACP methyl ester carboxylesterase